MDSNIYIEKCCFGQSELYGKILNVSLFGVPPYILFDPVKGTVTGTDIDILRILATTLQFMPNVLAYANWGHYDNGTFTNDSISSVRIRSSSLTTLLNNIFPFLGH